MEGGVSALPDIVDGSGSEVLLWCQDWVMDIH